MNRESERKRLTTDKKKIFVRKCPTIMSVTKAELHKLYIEIFDRLQEYEVAEETGQIIVPPVKVGDVVYAQKGCFYLPHATQIKSDAIITCEVIAIKETKKGKYILLKPLLEETFGMRSANGWFPFSSLGKTVFTSREDAVKALEGKEDEGK